MESITGIRTAIPRWIYVSLSIGGFVIPLAIWQIISSIHIFSALFLPSPESIASSFRNWVSGNLMTDIYISTYRVVSGFILATVIGVPVGIYIGTFKIIEAILQPINDFIRYMPATAFIPLVLLWIGIGESAKISIIFIGVFFQIIVMVADDVRRIPQKFLEAAYTMGARKGEVINYVILRGSAPSIFNILRVNMGWAWSYLVVAELIAANSGLGFAIMQAQRFMDTPKIFVGIIVIGFLGLLFDLSFRVMHRIFFAWSYK